MVYSHFNNDILLQCDKMYLPIYIPDYYESYNRTDSVMSIAVALKGKDGVVLATDSRLTSKTPSGGVLTHQDNITKLWSFNNKLGIANVCNIAGYESEIIELFNKRVVNSNEYSEMVNIFTYLAREDWHRVVNSLDDKQSQLLLNITPLIYEFVLVGYQDEKPTIKYVSNNRGLITLNNIERKYYITGAWDIARYLIPKFENGLSLLDIDGLKRLACYLIGESATYLDSIGGDIQMLVVSQTGIESLNSESIKKVVKDVESASKKCVEVMINELRGN